MWSLGDADIWQIIFVIFVISEIYVTSGFNVKL